MPSPRTDPYVVAVAGEAPEVNNDGWVSTCVGGGTVHMSGFFYRLHPEDFRGRSYMGPIDGALHADWPVTYETLAPYYDQVEQEIGVSGSNEQGRGAAPRNGPNPLAPVLSHAAAGLIDAGAKKLGWQSFPTARAILTFEYRGPAPKDSCS